MPALLIQKSILTSYTHLPNLLCIDVMANPSKCRMCESLNLTGTLHVPKSSKVGLKIVQCIDCNLVQGLCDEVAYANQNDIYKDPSLILSEISCDSPYSNIRVGKQQMAAKFFDILKSLPLNIKDIGSVIDVRSARGSFILKAPDYFVSASTFVGIEEDLYLHPPKNCYDTSAVTISDNSVYNLRREDSVFDFVYSCHTLEHYRKPNRYIQSIQNLLSPKGYLFIDVPALEDFIDHDLLDDFFYDKHLLYFTKLTLFRLLQSNGFTIVWARSSGNGCIEALARVNDERNSIDTKAEERQAKIKSSQVSDYSQRLNANRSQLPAISRNISDYISRSESKFVAFGAGRILDAFKVYGGLNLSLFSYYVDNYLFEASSIVNGLPILPMTGLQVQENLIFVLFTRENSRALQTIISRSHPSVKILHWSDFKNPNHSALR